MYQIKRMGRLPAFPDIRDYSPQDAQTKLLLETNDNETKDNIVKAFNKTLDVEPAKKADNSSWLPPVRDQGDLGSCVAFSWVCAMEYLHRKLYRNNIDFSQLFVYKMGRDHAFNTPRPGDTGLWLKHGIAALVRHGVMEAKRYPYDISKFDDFPASHLYGYADDFTAVKYYRLDSPKIPKEQHLANINKWIYRKWPVVCGFYCFESLELPTTAKTGEIPFPKDGEAIIGGHAVFIYGYDVNKEITNPLNNQTTKGAWRFRNSWSTSWGLQGDGWLPFDYLTDNRYGQPLADEFYSITSSKWLNLQDFE